MASVIKHSYVKGSAMKRRIAAHINYVQFRKDIDRESDEKARPFHTKNRDDYTGHQLKKEINRDLSTSRDVVHKLIVSPGNNNVDLSEYTREVFNELGRAKGQDLRYAFVIHENTDHHHAHVIVLGRDEENRIVRIDKLDHMRLRAFGDRYLEREHNIEIRLDRDMEQFCRERGLNIMYERESGRDFYEQLYRQPEKKDRKDSPRDLLEWERFNSDWVKYFELKEGREPDSRLGESSFHAIGRQSDLHSMMSTRHEIEQWREIAANDAGRREEAELKISELEKTMVEFVQEAEARTRPVDGWDVLDRVSRDFQRESKALQDLLAPVDSASLEKYREAAPALDQFIGIDSDDRQIDNENPLLHLDMRSEEELDRFLQMDGAEADMRELRTQDIDSGEDVDALPVFEDSDYSIFVEQREPDRSNDNDQGGVF